VFPGSSPITFTSPSSKARQKSGSFPPPALPGFNGRMTLSDSRQGRRLKATLRPLPSHRTGLPRLPEPPFRRAEPTTPADRAGAHIDYFPAHTAFPKWQEGRHPHCHFRGLLRLHSHYGPPDRSAAQRRPLSRGSNPCGYPHKPLVSYRINRQLSGWILPPLMIRAFGAHCQEQTLKAISVTPSRLTICPRRHSIRMLARFITSLHRFDSAATKAAVSSGVPSIVVRPC
jgi:hypothetical protein